MEWISIKNELPKEDMQVYAHTKNGLFIKTFYNAGDFPHFDGDIYEDSKITHWMACELPKPEWSFEEDVKAAGFFDIDGDVIGTMGGFHESVEKLYEILKERARHG